MRKKLSRQVYYAKYFTKIVEIYKNHFVRSCPFPVPNHAKCLVHQIHLRNVILVKKWNWIALEQMRRFILKR